MKSNTTQKGSYHIGEGEEFIKSILKFSEKGNISHYIVLNDEVLGFTSFNEAVYWIEEIFPGMDLKNEIQEMPNDLFSLLIKSNMELERKLNEIRRNVDKKVGVNIYNTSLEYIFSICMDLLPQQGTILVLPARMELLEANLVDLTFDEMNLAIENGETFSFEIIESITAIESDDFNDGISHELIIDVLTDEQEVITFSKN